MSQENKQPEQYYTRDRQAWRQWLEQYHATAQGVWLVYDKKRQGHVVHAPISYFNKKS